MSFLRKNPSEQKIGRRGAFILGGLVGALGMFGLPKLGDVAYEDVKEVGKKIKEIPSAIERKLNDEAPRLWLVSTNFIHFNDDLAPGMKAFVRYQDGVEEELASFEVYENRATFRLSKGIKNVDKFETYAVDRDGNKSEAKTLYVLEGVVLENNPNRVIDAREG